jgi:hypothetical protein
MLETGGGAQMIRGKQFFYHEDGSHYETWRYLARDTDTGEVFVVVEKSDPGGRPSSHRLSIAQFLSGTKGTRTDKLLELIGSLVGDTAAQLEDVPPR